MKRRAERDLVTIINSRLTKATEYSSNALAETRRKAWDYFLNRPRGDELAGRSQVQDTTIRDTHNALMATIMPSYATDNVVQFEPYGNGDEEAAEGESRAVNKIFTENNRGYQQLSYAVSDALLFRNGILKVWLEETTEKNSQRFIGGADEGAVTAYLQQQGAEDIKFARGDDELVAQYSISREELRVEAIEPAAFFVDPNMNTQDLQEADFVAERVIFSRGQLIELGVSRQKVGKLTQIADLGITNGQAGTNIDLQAKFQDGQSINLHTDVWAEQLVECHWVHMRLDGERWRFLISGEELLEKEPVQWWPYASGTGWPVPHRWSGLGLYDLLKHTQDSKTSMVRQLLDNLNFANNQRPVYDPAVTDKNDINNGAPGRGIRSKEPMSVGWMPFTDVTSNSLAALNYMDERGSRQAGAALDMATAEAQSIKDVSGLSVEMQTQPKEQMASYISRNLAETLVRDAFLLIHRTLREQYTGTITYRIRDEWVETRPAEWQPRNRLNVVVGLSPGDRRRHRAALEYVINMNLQLIAGGAANIATTYKTLHNAINDWMKAAELDGAEKYFLDPEGQEAQAGLQAAAEQQQQQSQIMEALQQVQIMLEQAKLREDARQHDDEMQFKYTELNAETEIEEAKLVEQGVQARISAARETEGTGAAGRRGGPDGAADR